MLTRAPFRAFLAPRARPAAGLALLPAAGPTPLPSAPPTPSPTGLAPTGSPPPSTEIAQAQGRLRVTVPQEPEATVLLNGKVVGAGAIEVSLRPGRYQLEVRAPGRSPQRGEVTIEAGETTPAEVIFPGRRRGGLRPGTMAVLGVVLLGVGAVAWRFGFADEAS